MTGCGLYKAIYLYDLQFLQTNNRWLVKLLEPAVTNIRSKDELATLLVSVLQKVNSAKEFLVEIVMDDVKNQGK